MCNAQTRVHRELTTFTKMYNTLLTQKNSMSQKSTNETPFTVSRLLVWVCALCSVLWLHFILCIPISWWTLFPDVFSFTGTWSIDYSCVDLPDKHMIPFSLWLERHPAIWNALFSFSLIVLQTSEKRRAAWHVEQRGPMHQVMPKFLTRVLFGAEPKKQLTTNQGCW